MHYKFTICSATCLLWATLSIIGLHAELIPFYRNIAYDKIGMQQFFDTRALEYGFSTYSRFLILNDCLIGMQTLVSTPIAITQKREFDDLCYQVSKSITKTNPTFAYAWYINALASILSGDVNTANDSLDKARITAPHEGWLAKRRILFFEKNAFLLPPQSIEGYRADLKLLGFGAQGLEYLALRYTSEPSMRPTIIAIIEALPLKRQKKFIELVASAAPKQKHSYNSN